MITDQQPWLLEINQHQYFSADSCVAYFTKENILGSAEPLLKSNGSISMAVYTMLVNLLFKIGHKKLRSEASKSISDWCNAKATEHCLIHAYQKVAAIWDLC